jgi:TP53 regulating kinase and related kinases
MEYFVNSITVKDFINGKVAENDVMMSLVELIGQNVARLHDNDMIHGDLTTSNLILTSPHDALDLHFIDFGLGYMSHSAEDKSVDLYVLERAFLSTHPGTEKLFASLLQSYFRTCSKDVKEISGKFYEVRLRGRKG